MHSAARRGRLAGDEQESLCFRILLELFEPRAAGGDPARLHLDLACREPRVELAGDAAVFARLLELVLDAVEPGGVRAVVTDFGLARQGLRGPARLRALAPRPARGEAFPVCPGSLDDPGPRPPRPAARNPPSPPW